MRFPMLTEKPGFAFFANWLRSWEIYTETFSIRSEIVCSITAKLLLAWLLFKGNVAEL